MTSCLKLRMGEGQRDDLGMVSVLLHENMCCDPSLEPSRRGGSNEGPQHILVWGWERLSLNCPRYPFLSGALVGFHALLFLPFK